MLKSLNQVSKARYRVLIYLAGLLLLGTMYHFRLQPPFFWYLLVISITLLIDSFIDQILWVRLTKIYILVALLTIGIYEGYLHSFPPGKQKLWSESSHKKFKEKDDMLGYVPLSGEVINVKKMYEGGVIYDVTYTFNQNRIRVTPSSNESSDKCFLLYGGSFTLGDGLNDSDTLANNIANLFEDYRVINFGLGGYGPHQMISSIEHGHTEQNAAGCKEIIAIYSAIPTHIKRAGGESAYDQHGPKYVFIDGKLKYVGNFDTNKSRVTRIIDHLLYKSKIHKHHFRNLRTGASESEIKVFEEIVLESRRLLSEKYKLNRFIVLLWDEVADEPRIYKKMSDFINFELSKQVELYSMSTILPGHVDGKRYPIHEFEGHPNAKANKLIAEYVFNILKD